MATILDTPISYLKGVGAQRAELLQKELHIFTYRDLLFHFPFRYIDRTVIHRITDIPETDGNVQLVGKIVSIKEGGVGRSKRLNARFEDESGSIELIWFQGVQYLKSSLKVNQTYLLFGKAKQYGLGWNISHPELSLLKDESRIDKNLQPVYSTTEKMVSKGLNSKGIEKLQATLLAELNFVLPDFFPDKMRTRIELLSRNEALRSIHFPSSVEIAEKATYRLKFEELFFLQLELIRRKEIGNKRNKGEVLEEVGNLFLQFYKDELPFPLTNAQQRVIKEIRQDFLSGIQMNRLLQGDVGSGKTLVALMTALLAVGNGKQVAIMAPTEILAQQHIESFQSLLQNLNVNVVLLTGSTPQKERKEIHAQLESGGIHIIIGTHALLEDSVRFNDLAYVVIDEQHRFGVAQRAKFWKKNTNPPHVLIMSATPIPRTLALSYYGDLDVSVIDELPPGRKPITTVHYKENARLKLFGFLKSEIAKGRQVYVVYPLINESETLDYQNLMEGYESISRSFPLPDYQVSIVHGQLKPEDKEYEMNRFVKGESHIMVATTVIEVGVNVPNASVMVIESAERFGLSQLHQLRGRVGRGAEKSYCILMTGNKVSNEAKTRLETMCRTNDGFEIAEVDLKLRGAGNLMGTQQSGVVNLSLADLTKDANILLAAREEAIRLTEKDPELSQEEHKMIARYLDAKLKGTPNWMAIS